MVPWRHMFTTKTVKKLRKKYIKEGGLRIIDDALNDALCGALCEALTRVNNNE